MHLPVGTLLQGGRYEIIRYISSGGFGCTYEARDTKFKSRVKSVAIKEFFVNDFCNRDAGNNTVVVATQSKVELVNKLRVKFLEEADALFELEHPNIVRVTDTFEENGTAYYVMEYISGTTLAAIVDKEGSLSEEKALGYIRQVADALKYVHSHNRSHFDVKPQNIMVDSNDRAVLIDFGVSKQYDEVNGVNTSTLVGYTPGYAPMELTYNDIAEFSPTTDIYSLGATLFNLVTGTVPPSAGRVNEDGLPVPVDVSAQVFDAIKAAMQPRRKDRPQNIDEFLCLVENGNVKGENGKLKDESDGETVLNGNVKAASKREGENLFTHTASESSFDEVKGENGKLVADEFHSIDVVEVPDSADAVISNESEKSQSDDAVILNASEKSHSANNEILRSAQNDNSANGRQNDKDGKEEVERRNEKEHSADAVISNESEKSQKNKPGKSLWLILQLLLIAVAGAWFLFGGTGNGDAPKRDSKDTLVEKPKSVVQDNSFKTREFTVGNVCFKMVAVEGGTFRMGSEDGESDEKPVHDVTVSDYYIGETEVTQALWEAVMGSNPSYFKGKENPVENVSYNDCLDFINELNIMLKDKLPQGCKFRLPTEAEWEYAARGGNKSQECKFSGSNSISKIAWYDGNSNNRTHPVKEKQANELGLYDMSGNVWEWCNDWYSSDYYKNSPSKNPENKVLGSYRVRRGGGSDYDAQICRVANRGNGSPDYRGYSDGLRLALGAPKETKKTNEKNMLFRHNAKEEKERLAAERRKNALVRDENELLCVACVDKNGKSILYFTGDEWKELSEDEKSNYPQLGVSIREDGHEFIIAASDCKGEYKFGGHDIDFEDVKNYEYDELYATFITGHNDTKKIVEQTKGESDSKGISGAPAAEAAWKYEVNDHDPLQWYLPSYSELQMICRHKDDINRFLEDYFPSFTPIAGKYWSSTECSNKKSWFVGMNLGYCNSITSRTSSIRVRAVASAK